MARRNQHYAAIGTRGAPIGRSFLIDAPGFERNVISALENELLRHCTESASQEDLETRICQAMAIAQKDRPNVGVVLKSLIDRGLLFPVPEGLKPRLKPGRDLKARITAFCVPTCGRDSLKTTLSTFSEAILDAGRTDVRIVLVDDSRSQASSDRNERMIRSLRKSVSLPRVFYADRSARSRFARRLARKSGVSADVVEFGLLGAGAIGPVTIGATRNCLLLETAGELIVSSDDDTVGRYVSAQVDEGARLRVCEESASAFHWAALSELKTLCDQARIPDFLGIHESLLGRDPWNVIQEEDRLGRTPIFEGLVPSFMERFHQRDRKVVFTRTGNFGDSGMGSGISFLFKPLAQLGPILSDPDRFRRLLTSHSAFFASAQATIAAEGDFMATHFGLDNRSTPIPYIPFGRGEDSLFGEMMARSRRGSFFGYLPYACAHFPAESRSAPLSRLWEEWTAVPIQFPTVVKWLFDRFPKFENPDALGEHLMKMASFPLDEFEVFVRCATLGSLSRKANRLGELCKPEFGLPVEVVRDIETGINHLERSLRNYTTSSVIGVPGPRTRNHIRHCRDLVFRTGQLVAAWPALVDAAKQLRSHGLEMTREL